LWVEHRAAAAGLRMLTIAPAVEDAGADVEFLAEDAVLGAAIAIDRGRRPGPAPRAGHTFSVERVGEGFGGGAIGVAAEVSPHDVGLFLVDAEHAGLDDV